MRLLCTTKMRNWGTPRANPPLDKRPMRWIEIVSPALSLAAILVLAALLVCVR